MRKPITFKEKVEARYERRHRDLCWIWQGATQQGRPSLNMRHVMRYIFEQEFGPIPEGHTLWRMDHVDECTRNCRHMLCVNPYHVQLRARPIGIYQRDTEWDIDDPAKTREYKRRVRPPKKEKKE